MTTFAMNVRMTHETLLESEQNKLTTDGSKRGATFLGLSTCQGSTTGKLLQSRSKYGNRAISRCFQEADEPAVLLHICSLYT